MICLLKRVQYLFSIFLLLAAVPALAAGKCPKCGKVYDESSGYKFCINDGAKLTATGRRQPHPQPLRDMEMVSVKGGCFQMGDPFDDGNPNEKPVNEICVSDFRIGKFEVTQGQWKKIMGENPAHFKKCGDSCPVENVSWDTVQEFIKEINRQTGKKYRLPTEAEWEYACRSGGRREKFCGGIHAGPFAWTEENSGNTTHPVGKKRPNGIGIYDMSGNVCEWVSDWYDETFYREGAPGGPPTGSSRVVRGGGWSFSPEYARAAVRNDYHPGFRDDILGFRLAQ
jgi:formylglycine-generating enzyme required for sulfatase activity